MERKWDGCRERRRREGRRDNTVDSIRWGGTKGRANRQKFDILKTKTTAVVSEVVSATNEGASLCYYFITTAWKFDFACGKENKDSHIISSTDNSG